jgi:hypothetical protein
LKIDKKELEKINDRMQGWIISRVESGTGEDVFIFHLVKGKDKSLSNRLVVLCANDLGGWLK